jgi:hypothetical protein
MFIHSNFIHTQQPEQSKCPSIKLDVVVHDCNLNTWEKDQEFKASLGYIIRHCLKKQNKQNISPSMYK